MVAMLTKLLHISLSAGLIVLGLTLLRPLLHRATDKWVCCLLWGLVAVRLLIPFNMEATIYVPVKSLPPVEELQQAMDIFCASLKMAALEQLLNLA